MRDKYVVLAYDDYYRRGDYGKAMTPLNDCVVIRLQDRFAAAGLHGYASCIQSVIEAAKESGVPLPANLEDVRDYFFQAAEQAEAYDRKKWPD